MKYAGNNYRNIMQLKLYRWFLNLAGPLIDLYLAHRKKNGKEDPKRFPERLGHPGFPRPAGALVWIHAASIGEVTSILPLIKAILNKHSNLNILVTTGTVTSANMLEKQLPDRAFHQYVPIDKMISVTRFLSHWRPDLAFWTESELWPNLIIETKKTGCPMIQLNARISIRSFEKWARYSSLAKKMLESFSLSLAQSKEDCERLIKLGAINAKYIGNLKYDAPALPADPAETGKLVHMIGERHIWVAASTHNGEEKFIAQAHQKVKEKYPDLLTIIIPRHPHRGKEIKSLLGGNYNIAIRSEGEMIEDSTDIYIANTISELGIFYRLSGIAFIGGSLIEHGGQNPLEAARLECALITGSHIENFVKIYHDLESENAIIKVKSADDLAQTLEMLLGNSEKQEEYANIALQFMNSKKGVLERYVGELSPYLKSL